MAEEKRNSEITIQIDSGLDSRYSRLMERAARAVLQETGVDGDACVVLTNDEQLRRLNFQYLSIDTPTDVLSFSSGETDLETNSLYLGDVVISFTRANLQALAAGHPVEDELMLLVVHGMLHLLGHDHAEPEEKERMWEKQAEILERLGCKISAPGV